MSSPRLTIKDLDRMYHEIFDLQVADFEARMNSQFKHSLKKLEASGDSVAIKDKVEKEENDMEEGDVDEVVAAIEKLESEIESLFGELTREIADNRPDLDILIGDVGGRIDETNDRLDEIISAIGADGNTSPTSVSGFIQINERMRDLEKVLKSIDVSVKEPPPIKIIVDSTKIAESIAETFKKTGTERKMQEGYTQKLNAADVEVMRNNLASKNDVSVLRTAISDIEEIMLALSAKRKKWPYFAMIGLGFAVGKNWDTIVDVVPKVIEAAFGITLPGF